MFTGLIQHLGRIAAFEKTPQGASVSIDIAGWDHRPALGDSIAVNGCCLTVARSVGDILGFDVIPQTLQVTTLGRLRHTMPVNLEHAATPATLLGGHIVQGHVDGVGSAIRIAPAHEGEEGEVRLRVDPPDGLMDFITPRGSIAIDGVSLTVAEVGESSFDIALIPLTLERTTLARVGEMPTPVNLEADCLIKALVHYLNRRDRR